MQLDRSASHALTKNPKIPPQVPLTKDGGAVGERGGTTGAQAASTAGGAAAHSKAQPAATTHHRRLCERRDIKLDTG